MIKKNIGAGCILASRKTGRICLQQRSRRVKHPLTWATWGGQKEDDDDTIRETVIRELHEEAGIIVNENRLEYVGTFAVLEDDTLIWHEDENSNLPAVFIYHNYIAYIDDEIDPTYEYNDETNDHDWFDIRELMDKDNFRGDLHFGLDFMLEHVGDQLVRKLVL